ncbi:hypothetical protein EJ08DRAFT_143371 [Tothia fuscella]|uniref:Uncharacterized protein n=1 Tax=Tothia fuscella TaxID=1048955 RepID=A0A9P4U312_9PEZI|nr:hypothetical protein EJ08DRAFT_143371 [Tothia fuscella]
MCKKFYDESREIAYSRLAVVVRNGNGFAAKMWLNLKRPEILAMLTRLVIRDEPVLGNFHGGTYCILLNIGSSVHEYALLSSLQRIEISLCQQELLESKRSRFRGSEAKYCALTILVALRYSSTIQLVIFDWPHCSAEVTETDCGLLHAELSAATTVGIVFNSSNRPPSMPHLFTDSTFNKSWIVGRLEGDIIGISMDRSGEENSRHVEIRFIPRVDELPFVLANCEESKKIEEASLANLKAKEEAELRSTGGRRRYKRENGQWVVW